MNHVLFVHQPSADLLSLMPFFECKEIKVSTAQTLEEGLSLIKSCEDINVVIAETELPDGEGVSLAEKVSADTQKRFYLTGKKSSKTIEKYLRESPDSMLSIFFS